jgi:hypothetical protein
VHSDLPNAPYHQQGGWSISGHIDIIAFFVQGFHNSIFETLMKNTHRNQFDTDVGQRFTILCSTQILELCSIFHHNLTILLDFYKQTVLLISTAVTGIMCMGGRLLGYESLDMIWENCLLTFFTFKLSVTVSQ